MGVTPTRLAERYPRLYHMADGDSWNGIQQYGLLDTCSLLDLFEASAEKRRAALGQQRREGVLLENRKHDRAVIRDQKPLNRRKLEGCLQDCSFDQWLALLNSRVFFWLTEARLQTLLCAREYCDDAHVVLVLDTLRLATDYEQRVTLAPLNTGTTQPFAHPRGLASFFRMCDYPFEERLRRAADYTVVELAVEGGVPDVMKYVVGAALRRCSGCNRKQVQTIRTVKELYP
jgi:hypothetical protein